MKTSRLLPLLIVLLAAPVLRAAVPINTVPTPDPFGAIPSVADWSTLSVGTAGVVINATDFDNKVIAAADATAITTTLGSSGTYPPSTNGIARQNTGVNTGGTTFLQTRPTGIDYLLLMATLVNSTGGPLNSLRLAYEYSSANSGVVEDVEGLRAYFSMTGAPGSWTLIPELSVDTTATYDAPDFLTATIALPAPLADAGTVYVLWADQNSTGQTTDTSNHIRNFAASPGIDCTVAGTPANPVRLPGVDPADPSDDAVTFSITITGSGADLGPGWTIASGPSTGTMGNYGATQNFNLPIADFAGGPLTLRVEDQNSPACFFQQSIVAPPFLHAVTASNSPLITFDFSNVGEGSYAQPVLTITEPGWSGGTNGAATASNVQTQPAPSSQFLKYFHMTTVAALTTDPVDLSAIKGGLLKGELQLAFYSTSNTGLDDADTLNFRIEVAQDGDFSNTAGGNLITTDIRDVPAGSAPAFGDSIAAAVPHIELNTVGFPTDDFTFHTFSASVPIPGGATAPLARIVAQGINGISNSEHVLVDNIRFSSNTDPTLNASIAGPAVWSNNGTVTDTDDGFTTPVNIEAFNVGASTGWTSDEVPPRAGLYATPNPVVFGPFPGRTDVSVQLEDNANPAATASLLFTPPAASLTATLVANSIVRQENGPGDADDTVTFDIDVAATNLGPAFTATVPLAPATTTVAGAGNYPAPATPVTLTISNIPNSAAVLNVVIADASYPTAPAPVTIAVAVPAPTSAGPVIVGQSDFGAGLTDVLALAFPAPEWHNFPASRELRMSAGIAADSVVESEVLDLSSVGEVSFSAQLIAKDVSAGTNFEQPDRFKAELLIDGGLVPGDIINLVAAFDIGNGAGATTVGDNGAPDGFINGYSGAAGTDLITNVVYATEQEDLNAHLNRDEFNTGLQTVDNFLNNTLNLAAVIPSGASSVQLRITGASVAGSEALIVANVLFTGTTGGGDSDGDGVSDADEAIMGTDPNNAADVLRLSSPTGSPAMVTFPSKSGAFYRVYVSDDATPATHLAVWIDSGLPTLVGNGGNLSFTLAPGQPRRFSRLHVMQTDGPWPATFP